MLCLCFKKHQDWSSASVICDKRHFTHLPTYLFTKNSSMEHSFSRFLHRDTLFWLIFDRARSSPKFDHTSLVKKFVSRIPRGSIQFHWRTWSLVLIWSSSHRTWQGTVLQWPDLEWWQGVLRTCRSSRESSSPPPPPGSHVDSPPGGKCETTKCNHVTYTIDYWLHSRNGRRNDFIRCNIIFY